MGILFGCVRGKFTDDIDFIDITIELSFFQKKHVGTDKRNEQQLSFLQMNAWMMR